MLRLPFLILVAGKELREDLVGAGLALLVCLERTVPPAGLIQIVGQCYGTKVFHEKRTRSTWQALDVCLVPAAVDAALLMDFFPGGQGKVQSLRDRSG